MSGPPGNYLLKDWQLLKLTEETLEIGKSSHSFSSSYFDDKEKYDQLTGFCRDFSQRDIKVKIFENNQSSTREKLSSEEGSKEAETEKKSDPPPPVQDILNMFQGEIK